MQVENGWENDEKRRFWVSHKSGEQPEGFIISRVWLKKLGHPNTLSVYCLHFTEAYKLASAHRTAVMERASSLSSALYTTANSYNEKTMRANDVI